MPTMYRLAFVVLILFSCTSKSSSDVDSPSVVVEVDPSKFLKNGLSISTVPCTLSDGSTAECYEVVSKSVPADHQMGPWCPTSISDSADKGGIWLEGGEVYDVDGAFIRDMASFYKDEKWKMYDADGNIFVTNTKEECAAAARPDVDVKYQNYCVECLPSYVTDISQTYLIPTSPVWSGKQVNNNKGRGSKGARGLAFNGTRFDAPAPTNAILGAYTLAPFDDAGGHINLHAGYHYHAATGKTTEYAQEDGHAPMIGYAMDGYGLYAHLDAEGKTPEDLDVCRGHFDSIRGYHYHVDAAGSNNFINCFSGVTADAGNKKMGMLPYVVGGLASLAFGLLIVLKSRKR